MLLLHQKCSHNFELVFSWLSKNCNELLSSLVPVVYIMYFPKDKTVYDLILVDSCDFVVHTTIFSISLDHQ